MFVLITIIFFVQVSIYILNYYGYCIEPMPYELKYKWCRLSTKERLDKAIDHYLQFQITMDYNEIAKKENIEFDDVEKNFTLLPYKSRREFFKENPNCCERSWGLVEGDHFLFWERAHGAGDGMFNFKHKVCYKDKNGVRKEIETTNTFIMVYNCGGVSDQFYYGKIMDIRELK